MSLVEIAQPAIVLLAGVAALLIAVRYPAILYALFLTAGLYKADPRLAFLGNIDLTALLLVATLAIVFVRLVGIDHLHIPKIPAPLFGFHLAICALLVFSLLYTAAPVYGMDKVMRYVVFVSAALLLPFFVLRTQKDFTALFATFVAVALASSIEVLRGGTWAGGGRTEVFGSVYLMLGRFTGLGVVLVTTYFLARAYHSWRDWLIGLFWVAVAGIIAFALVAAAGRGPLVAVGVSIIATGLVAVRFKYPMIFVRSRINLLIGVLILAASVLVLVINPDDVATRMLTRMASLFGGADKSASERIGLYTDALQAIAQHPVLGLGAGGFSVFSAGYDRRLYPHNIFLEFSVELGLLGLFFFSALLLWTQVQIINGLRKSREQVITRLLITCHAVLWLFLANAMVTGDMTDNRVLFAIVGVSIAACHLQLRQMKVEQGALPAIAHTYASIS